MTAAAPDEEPTRPAAVPLLAPRDGLPPVVDSAEALARTVEAFAAGTGPIAIDAERASGYRYSQRAYLVQLRREGSGTALVDPIACPDLSALDAAIADAEWILHAATQDLACLAEVGLRPRRLFDTELAGRLLSLPRVGLGPLVEELLGYRLEKGHGAADWSTRPLPQSWLVYAALDVELLVPLRDALAERLERAGKLDWALQDFRALLDFRPKPPPADPWRRTSGIHRVHDQRGLAYVRELWIARDRIAQRRDIAPGRLLPDRALVAAAIDKPRTRPDLAGVDGFGGRSGRRYLGNWWTAVQRAASLSEAELPARRTDEDGPPAPRSWPDRNPAAAERLSACRQALQEIAEARALPVENLLLPDAVRRLAWDPPESPTPERIAEQLRARGARQWQLDLTADVLAGALT